MLVDFSYKEVTMQFIINTCIVILLYIVTSNDMYLVVTGLLH